MNTRTPSMEVEAEAAVAGQQTVTIGPLVGYYRRKYEAEASESLNLAVALEQEVQTRKELERQLMDARIKIETPEERAQIVNVPANAKKEK